MYNDFGIRSLIRHISELCLHLHSFYDPHLYFRFSAWLVMLLLMFSSCFHTLQCLLYGIERLLGRRD